MRFPKLYIQASNCCLYLPSSIQDIGKLPQKKGRSFLGTNWISGNTQQGAIILHYLLTAMIRIWRFKAMMENQNFLTCNFYLQLVLLSKS
jgi:hypothetical protein